MQIVIDIPEEEYIATKVMVQSHNIGSANDRVIANGTPLPEHHGDLKDIGNMELLNVQVHDDYSKGWHNAIEYCVRQLRERPTIIPATRKAKVLAVGGDGIGKRVIEEMVKQTATKEGE